MNRLARAFVSISLLLASVGLATGDVRAAEEPAVVRALLDSAALTAAARPTYGGIDVAPDGTITLSDLKTAYQPDSDPEKTMTYEVETLVLAGVREVGTGLFEVESAEWSHATFSAGTDWAAAIPLITARSLYIHQPDNASASVGPVRAHVLAREYTIPEALMLVSGLGIVLEDMTGTWDGDPMRGDGTSRFTARRISIPGDLFEQDGENPLAMAGYSELVLAIDGVSTMTYSDDAVGFEFEMRVDGTDMGSLVIEAGAGGIPMSLFTAVDTTEPDPLAMLSFAEGMSLDRLRIRFEDNSLTGRVLALLADAEGVDVETFVAEETAEIDLALQQTLGPELAAQVSSAFSTYLKNPQTITFALAPLQPVRLDQVMAGLANPVGLIELLKPSITAND